MEVRTPKLQHQQLIVTLYGLYGRAAGGTFPVSCLVEMLGTLGVGPAAVRSTVSRLKRSGVLLSRRNGIGALYSLSEDVLDAFQEGDQRIYAPQRSKPTDPWSLVIFSVPESERNRRYELRTELTSLGFGAVGSGVAIAPSNVLPQAVNRLKRRGLEKYVEFFSADYQSEEDIRAKVSQWWDLESLDEQYADFIDLYGAAEAQWVERIHAESVDGEPAAALIRDAFAFYVQMLTIWRRFPYRDPNLPLEFLPEGWKAPAAKHAFWAVDALLAPIAKSYACSLLVPLVADGETLAIQESTSGQ